MEIVFLIRNQGVGIFPPKSKNLFYLSLALIWCLNIQDGTIPVVGDRWPSNSAGRENNNNKKYKEISRFGLFFRSNISETVKDIRVPFPLWPRSRVTLPNGANVVSVIFIVSEIYCRQYQEFRMLTYLTEQVGIFARTVVQANNKNKEISRSGLCVSFRISPKRVRDVWVPYPFMASARVGLPNGTNVVSEVVIVSEIWSRQHHEFRMLTGTSVVNPIPVWTSSDG